MAKQKSRHRFCLSSIAGFLELFRLRATITGSFDEYQMVITAFPLVGAVQSFPVWDAGGLVLSENPVLPASVSELL